MAPTKKSWTREAVIDALRFAAKNGEETVESALEAAACKIFGSLEAARDVAGVLEIEMAMWSKVRLQGALTSYAKHRQPLTRSARLVAEQRFGSLDKALSHFKLTAHAETLATIVPRRTAARERSRPDEGSRVAMGDTLPTIDVRPEREIVEPSAPEVAEVAMVAVDAPQEGASEPDVALGFSTGQGVLVRPGVSFNAVRVFAATMPIDRQQLGEKVTSWVLEASIEVIEYVVTQSSDHFHHCVTITVFYRTRDRADDS